MGKPEKIVFIHSLNNYTGSPNVLSVIIRNMVSRGYDVDLITSKGEGFLSNLEGVNYRYTSYRWLDNKAFTALLLLFSQIQLFFMILFSRNQGVVYYINTIVPVGAAWACRLTGKDYVYHVHENMQLEKPVYAIFRWTYKHCNRKSIFVSHYLKGTAVNCRGGTVIHNALSKEFVKKAKKARSENKLQRKTILMISSLRSFKGIYEFVNLARKLPDHPFELVLSASHAETESFITEVDPPDNITIYPRQEDVHPFYRRSRVLMQLSHPESWVETFGMTILEAMAYGVPAIVPYVGGPVELVEDGKNGYLVDPHNLEKISTKIRHLYNNEKHYERFSQNALRTSTTYNADRMITEIENYICI